MQLRDALQSRAISASGGKVYVTSSGGTAKSTLYTAAGAALANPITPTNGSIEFWTADALGVVDLYGYAPTGHGFVRKGIKPSGDASLLIDTTRLDSTFVIPFNVADQAGDATETPTGFVLPGAVQPNVAIDVVTVDAAITLEVGTLASDSGDADGFIDAVSMATAGYIKPTLLASGDTMGALLSVLDSANAGDDAPEQDVTMIGKQVTYTLLTAADTAAGFIVLPLRLRPSLL
jgi:hypothetical protein